MRRPDLFLWPKLRSHAGKRRCALIRRWVFELCDTGFRCRRLREAEPSQARSVATTQNRERSCGARDNKQDVYILGIFRRTDLLAVRARTHFGPGPIRVRLEMVTVWGLAFRIALNMMDKMQSNYDLYIIYTALPFILS